MSLASSSGGLHTEPHRQHVQAALRKTTEFLASELAAPHQHAPPWSAFEWAIARAVATMHGISPLLACTTQWQGPPDWAQFLTDQREHTARRYERTRALLQLVDARARSCGVGLIALKGAALHALGVYLPGERPMADVDLLAREEDAPCVGQMLKTLGFRETYSTWKHRVFEPNEAPLAAAFGEHSDNAMKIELHTRIREILPLREVELTQQMFARILQPGINDYPSKSALMAHLLLHASGAMIFRALRLINLHDIACLSARMTKDDWDAFLGNANNDKLWWAFPPLYLVTCYYPVIPEDVLASIGAGCPALLRRVSERRRLTDVSCSHLWISAFPGIEWAASVTEMLAYIKRRVLPNAELLAMREVIATTQGFASEDPWMRLSQRQRMVRWLVARQPRGETLRPVRIALAGSG